MKATGQLRPIPARGPCSWGKFWPEWRTKKFVERWDDFVCLRILLKHTETISTSLEAHALRAPSSKVQVWLKLKHRGISVCSSKGIFMYLFNASTQKPWVSLPVSQVRFQEKLWTNGLGLAFLISCSLYCFSSLICFINTHTYQLASYFLSDAKRYPKRSNNMDEYHNFLSLRRDAQRRLRLSNIIPLKTQQQKIPASPFLFMFRVNALW